MEIVKKIPYFLLPFIILTVSLIMLFSKRDYFSCFLTGAKEGVKSSFGLIPSMCALVVGVNMLFEAGI